MIDTTPGELWRPTVALAALEKAAPYDLAQPDGVVGHYLYPVYLRGLAYIALGNGHAAANQFQKILEHPGVTVNRPIGVLARLGLARAYALEAGLSASDVSQRPKREDSHTFSSNADREAALGKARRAYEEFLSLWESSDHSIPIFRQARAEFQKTDRGAEDKVE